MTREEAIVRYGKPDKMGHITRFSDSSLYDEKCVMCGLVDFHLTAERNHPTIYNTRCSQETAA